MGRKMKCLNISITHDQREMFFAMVDHSHRLLMSFFSDIEDMIPFRDTTTRIAVYFFDERTGCVDPKDIALLKRSKKLGPVPWADIIINDPAGMASTSGSNITPFRSKSATI